MEQASKISVTTVFAIGSEISSLQAEARSEPAGSTLIVFLFFSYC